MIYVTSDFHFGHTKDFLWQPRGFTSWEEHAEKIIENYNSIVTDEDIVYILGDCMLSNDGFGLECLHQLKGHKLLAFGNHDTEARINKYRDEDIFEMIDYGYRLKYGKISFYLQHYPATMGNYKDQHPTICLSGHTHSPNKFQNIHNQCYNVSVDAHNCYPVSIDEIMQDIKQYRYTHPIIEYVDRSPYCEFCRKQETCLARTHHDYPCETYEPMPEEMK